MAKLVGVGLWHREAGVSRGVVGYDGEERERKKEKEKERRRKWRCSINCHLALWEKEVWREERRGELKYMEKVVGRGKTRKEREEKEEK